MRHKNIIFNYKNQKIRLKVSICNAFQQISGLIFTKKDKAKALLFEFKKTGPAIHSYFVFFPFIAVWLDKNNKVIKVKKVKPFTFHIKPKKPFKKLIEIPCNKKYSQTIKCLGNLCNP